MKGKRGQQPALQGEIVPAGGRKQALMRQQQADDPDYAMLQPFGWTPTGRLAELAERGDPDERLSREAALLVFKGRNDNTTRTYRRQWWKFVQWCGQTGRQHLPATPQTIIEWMNELWRTPGRYNQPTAPSGVNLSLASISVAHQRARRTEVDSSGRSLYGYVSPTWHDLVQTAFKGYRKQWLAAGYRPDKSYPLSKAELRRMVETIDLRTPMGACDATLLTIGYDLGGRRIELCDLRVRDVELHVADRENVTEDDYILINIPMSKTDQAGEGAEIPLYAHPPENASTCPVRMTLRWLALLAGLGEVDPRSYFFRVVLTGGKHPKNGQPRKGRITDQPITGFRVADVVDRAVELAGLNEGGGKRLHIVPHSLRSGSATAAGEEGADTPAMNAHYRWSPNGTTASTYVRAGRRKSLNPARMIWKAKKRHSGATGDGE